MTETLERVTNLESRVADSDKEREREKELLTEAQATNTSLLNGSFSPSLCMSIICTYFYFVINFSFHSHLCITKKEKVSLDLEIKELNKRNKDLETQVKETASTFLQGERDKLINTIKGKGANIDLPVYFM